MNKTLLLTAFLVLSGVATNVVASEPIIVRTKNKPEKHVRSKLLDETMIAVTKDSKGLYISFEPIIRDVNLNITNVLGECVYQQTITPQIPSLFIEFINWNQGDYTIYFTDITGICLYCNFIIE